MDLMLDQEAFKQASADLKNRCDDLKNLRTTIFASFEQLRKDWDSDAGKQFFTRFENSLLKNLDDYSKVFDYMSKNLTTASNKYEEVFRAADTVVNTQY